MAASAPSRPVSRAPRGCPSRRAGRSRFGAGVISCPSTVRPVSVEAATFPEALTGPGCDARAEIEGLDRDLAAEERDRERSGVRLGARRGPGLSDDLGVGRADLDDRAVGGIRVPGQNLLGAPAAPSIESATWSGWPGCDDPRRSARWPGASGCCGAAAAIEPTTATSNGTTRSGTRLTALQGSSRACGRHATRAAPPRRRASTPNSRRRTCSGSEVATWTPISTPTIDVTPRISAGRTRRLPVARLPPRADGGRRDDREERRRRRLDLAEAERDEGRHEQDPAADAEEARQDPGREPEADRQQRSSSCSSGDQPDADRREQRRKGHRHGAARETALHRRADQRAAHRRDPDEERRRATSTLPRSGVQRDAGEGSDHDRPERGRRGLLRPECRRAGSGAARSRCRRRRRRAS